MTDDGAVNPASGDELISIGELAESTGIAPDTIRVWERRYGRPVPVRLASGHRRYTQDHVRWLRRMAEALALGMRPSKVVHLSDAELDRVLSSPRPSADDTDAQQRIIASTREYRRAEIVEELRALRERLGPVAFVNDGLGPLLDLLGRAWADGEVQIRHEHFLSEIIEDELRALLAELPAGSRGPRVVLTTLAGEAHGIGILMARVLCASRGVQVCSLGTHTPLAEIVAAAREFDAVGVALSVTLASGGVRTDRVIADLRRRLPDEVRLAVGGRGARDVRRGPRGVDYLETVSDLTGWLDLLQTGPGSA
jgi:DNA-binding transcriptional MerR regulator